MRKLALVVAACFCILCAHAAYLKDVPMTLTQPDGSILHCFASGDEYFNYLHDANGYTIMQHPKTGYYVYADKIDGKLVATEFVAGKYDPASKQLQPFNLISPKEWMAKRKIWHDHERPRQNKENWKPNHGTLNNIVIFIRFADDQELTNSFSTINDMFNNVSENAVSMRSYFRSASYGAIDIPTYFFPSPNGDVIVSYQDEHPRSYFQPYNASSNPTGYTEEERADREFSLLERAVTYINENYPIPQDLDIDFDGNGYVDNICFILKGTTGAWSSLLWPHKWSLYDRTVYINGKIIDTYNIQLADGGNFTTSTLCHEMNHSLSAPDLYNYNGTGLTPIGIWDLMATNTTPPQHCGAYMKMKYGHWIDDIPEITQAGTYTLNPISSATPDNIAYKIATEDPNQFYVLEYRDKSSLFEQGLPGTGLLIYRIDTRFYGNQDYNLSQQQYNEIYIFRPNGSLETNGNISNAHFSNNVNRTEFSSSTSAYPFYSDGTLDQNIRIYDVTNSGSTISFKYGANASSEAPTNVALTIQGRDVMLTWDAADNAYSYNVYRNGNWVGNTTETNFTEADLSYGSYNYFIKSVDSQGLLSTPSESVLAVISPSPSNLSVVKDNANATLSWAAPEWILPETPIATLTHGDQVPLNAYMNWQNHPMYWGHRHLSENILDYDGMKLYNVSFHTNKAGGYNLSIYAGTSTVIDEEEGSTTSYTVPQALVYSQPVAVSAAGWNDIELDHPFIIDGNQDLWIFINNPDTINGLYSYVCNAGNSSGFYYSPEPTSYTFSNANYAFLIKAYLTDGTYTYNLYDNGSIVNESPIAETNYTIENVTGNAIHQYTVTTNYSGGESMASNKAGLAIGTHSLESLNLGLADKMTITANSTLAVSGTLVSTNPDHFILEDGAQLINDSEGVKATVKKAIQPYTDGKNDGWNLIASPITENLDVADDVNGLVRGDYDLYIFDQAGNDGKEWRNYEEQAFTTIDNKVGYLYSNSNETMISFAGTLAGTAESTTITRDNTIEFPGFNLIGNPYPCEVYTSKPFYTVQYDAVEDKTYFDVGNNPILPCSAILVQAQTAEESVSFSKTPIANQASITMKLSKSNIRSAHHIDQARISFEADYKLSKYTWDDASSTIYIPQNGQNFAVAYADGASEMPINIHVVQNGTYTISFEEINLNLNYLHLIDNLSGNEVDLLATPNYTFEAKTTDYASRFKLVFSICEDADGGNDSFAFVSNGQLHILNNGEAQLQIVDIMGRILSSETIHGSWSKALNLNEGIYIVRLIQSSETKTQKVVVR